MEERHFLWKIFLWVGVIVQIAMSTASANLTTTTESPAALRPQILEYTSPTGYAWSSWSSWTSCSRTCGGGVATQERQCLPRNSDVSVNGTLPPPVITVRVTRQALNQDCLGVAKRFRECNNQPCSAEPKSLRAEQCAAYDRRPFRGRFYTWVPYIDGNSPCTLNCRPLGQQFYASLAWVADGTPCTKPGHRAICVQGTCKKITESDLSLIKNVSLTMLNDVGAAAPRRGRAVNACMRRRSPKVTATHCTAPGSINRLIIIVFCCNSHKC